MVTFTCDQCGHVATHTVFDYQFAVKWLRSNRTEVAKCSEYGSKTNCTGILRSGLTNNQIDEQMRKHGYANYISNSLDKVIYNLPWK